MIIAVTTCSLGPFGENGTAPFIIDHSILTSHDITFLGAIIAHSFLEGII